LAVVIKGTSCAGAARLAVHLTRTDTNERAEVRELRGVAAENLRGALLEMEAVASGSRATKPFYHASINTPAGERLTDEQRAHAIDTLEARLGLTGQPRVVVVHEKEGREHCHIVWSRIQLESMRTISDSHNYRKHEEVARSLEREFGHARVQGAHVEREGRPRPERTPSHAEMLQAERTGLSPQQVKAQVTELWRSTENGKDFFVALWNAGYVLARGDRRDFVIIDQRGGTHSLARRIEGATAKDVRARMADLDIGRLPSIADAKRVQVARQERDAMPSMEPQPQPTPPRDEEERKARLSGNAGMDWTNKGGMVEQQRSAMDWVKEANDARTSRREQTERRQERSEAEEKRQRVRQDLLREFGREPEEDRGHDLDLGQGRSR
jgi:Relaxase/Mobilisation nuclease domain